MECIIRIATEQDTTHIISMGSRVHEFVTSEDTDNFWPEPILRDAIKNGNDIVLVAEIDEKIVGFIIVNCNKHLSKALIENVFVSPSCRNHNIGSRLLNSVVALVRQQGFRYLSTLVPTNDRAAITMYQKAGFQTGNNFTWLDIQNSND